MLVKNSNIHDSIKEKVFRFVRSKTLTNDFEDNVTIRACKIDSCIVVYVNIVKATIILKSLIRFPHSLRLDKLNKFSLFSRSS